MSLNKPLVLENDHIILPKQLENASVQDNVKVKKTVLPILLLLICAILGVSIVFAFIVTNEGTKVQEFYLKFAAVLPTVQINNLRTNDKVVSCYYNMPNKGSTPQLLPANIDPYLCTHINIAFGQVKHKIIYLDSSQQQAIKEVVKLKKINSNLKILLSVGGAGNRDGFSDMVIDHVSRKTFIRSIKYTLRNHSLDGIDLDWEFPGIQHSEPIVSKREKQHFTQLLREIRMEYLREKRNYLLTVAVAAPKVIVDFAYDVEQLNMYVDYVNLMTYDFHYFTQFTPFTGLNSPLYARSSEHLYLATLNINYTVHMYLSKGLQKSKIVLGIPTYGHTFSLVNANNTNIGSPAAGFGKLGNLGFVSYSDICLFMYKTGDDVTLKTDDDAKVPYLYKDSEWVSYDSPLSVKEKANYIKSYNLRGAMIYSLNADDYDGICNLLHSSGSEKFPLTLSIHNALHHS